MASTTSGWAQAAPAASASAAALVSATSCQRRINVSGIRRIGQRLQPSPDRIGSDPVALHEGLTLAQCRLEAGEAERLAARQRRLRHAALDGRELERQHRDRSRQSRQRFGFEALYIKLDEGGPAMARDQRIER